MGKSGQRRRAKFPLYLKIVAWFLLNLALLAGTFFFLFRSQFGFGLDTLLKGASGEKIGAAVTLISDDLRDAGSEGWEEELERFSEAYGVTFSLYRSSGEFVRGPDKVLPEAVTNEVVKFALPLPSDRLRPPGGPRPRGPDDRPRDDRPPPRDRIEDGPSGPRMIRQPGPLFLVKTTGPKTFWLGSRVQLGTRGPREEGRRPGEPRGERGPPPDILIARTGRLSGNNLLPDLRPWFAAGVGVIALCVLFWIPFVRGITRSLRQIRDATEEVAEGKFGTHVDAARSDELGQLGRAINRMSDRLKGYVDGQRRFLGDIAHELCSPIARMQMAFGVLEQKATPEQRPRVEGVREELEHMADMVNELLTFSKASLRPESAKVERVPLAPLLQEVADRETGGREAEILIEESAGLAVMADRNLLMRALGNLLRNAMRHAGEEGPISFDAEAVRRGKIAIKVADRGPGVPEKAIAQVFDPFYRPDEARSRERGGAGLGLAIVKTCVEACGGSISCRNTDPGFEVTITLDAAPSWT